MRVQVNGGFYLAHCNEVLISRIEPKGELEGRGGGVE